MLTCAIAYAADYMHACVRAKVYAVWNANAAADGAGGSYTVCCSEGGMSDFVARTDEEWARPHNIFLIIKNRFWTRSLNASMDCIEK